MRRVALPPSIGNRVDVAEQLEDDRAAVGRQVERQPRAFVGRELERRGRRERQTRAAAAGGVGAAPAALRDGWRKRETEQRRGERERTE